MILCFIYSVCIFLFFLGRSACFRLPAASRMLPLPSCLLCGISSSSGIADFCLLPQNSCSLCRTMPDSNIFGFLQAVRAFPDECGVCLLRSAFCFVMNTHETAVLRLSDASALRLKDAKIENRSIRAFLVFPDSFRRQCSDLPLSLPVSPCCAPAFFRLFCKK